MRCCFEKNQILLLIKPEDHVSCRSQPAVAIWQRAGPGAAPSIRSGSSKSKAPPGGQRGFEAWQDLGLGDVTLPIEAISAHDG